MLLDVDRFKEVNDTLGHPRGDKLLIEVADRLREVVRESDTVARLGGDEFAVLLPSMGSVADAEVLAQRVYSVFSTPFDLDGLLLHVDTSVGLAVLPDHADDITALLQRADVAMYTAKAAKAGVAIYSPTGDEHSPSRLVLLGDLRRALDSEAELSMHYQPKIDLRTGDVTGLEALLRWEHPVRGFIPPAHFIPLAEQTGLIKDLTARVLGLVFAQTAAWARDGRRLPVAVNLSARNLLEPDLDTVVAALLAMHELDPELLEFEITESAIIEDPVRAGAMLTKLTALGIGVAVDDFGIGSTSMSQLRSMPLRTLKIDRSFVTHLVTDPGGASLVRAIIELAHDFGLIAVAEGVEDREVTTVLRELGLRRRPGLPVVQAGVGGGPRCRPRAAGRRGARGAAQAAPPTHPDGAGTLGRVIDLRLLRDDPDLVRASQRARGESVELVDELLAADEARRAAGLRFDELRAEQKTYGKKVAAASGEEKAALVAAVQDLAASVKAADAEREAADVRASELLAALPNVVEAGVPAGGEADFEVLEHVGTPRDFAAEGFTPRDHLELGEGLRRHRHGARREGVRVAVLLPDRDRGAARARAAEHGRRPGGGGRLHPDDHADAGAAGDHGRHRVPRCARRRDLPARGRRPLPDGHLGGGARRLPRRRDPRPVGRAAALCGLVRVLPPRSGVVRQGHPRDHPRPPVPQGGDVLVVPGRGRGRPSTSGCSAWEREMLAKVELPYRIIDVAAGDLGSSRGAEVRLRGVAAVAGAVDGGDVDLELHDLPGAPPRRPRAHRRTA